MIVCALDKELRAYSETTAKIGSRTSHRDLEVVFIDIGQYKGIGIKLPTMGPVSCAVTTSKAIEVFSPKFVAMSGICAGIQENSKMGQLIIAGSSWDYQSGKWTKDKFEGEAYPVEILENTRVNLSSFIERDGLIDKLEAGLECARPQIKNKPKIAPLASGSAVLAQAEKVTFVAEQHRKAAGIDMEMYGLYRAVTLSARNDVQFFGAKAVVDFGDEVKSDALQEYGAIVSARFVCEALQQLLDHSQGSM
ncbi:MAG TPA: hypothetical protein DC046_13480 [Rhodospirillaceae bacterium]|nr:hypothetical protein [Rhodospirillaceae bacterium]